MPVAELERPTVRNIKDMREFVRNFTPRQKPHESNELNRLYKPYNTESLAWVNAIAHTPQKLTLGDVKRLFYNQGQGQVLSAQKQLAEPSEQQVVALADRLTQCIRSDELLVGDDSPTEDLFESLLDSSLENEAVKAIAHIYYHAAPDDSHTLEGVLVLCACVPRQKARMSNTWSIAAKLLKSENPAVRRQAITCFEVWNDKDGIKLLQDVSPEPAHLKSYANRVIGYLTQDGA